MSLIALSDIFLSLKMYRHLIFPVQNVFHAGTSFITHDLPKEGERDCAHYMLP